jgi:hypothetical protein
MAAKRLEVLGLFAEIVLKAEGDPAMKQKIAGLSYPGNSSLAPRDAHDQLDALLAEKAGVERDAPQWAHDALDAIWDFVSWLVA